MKLSKARVYELLARSATPRLPRVVERGRVRETLPVGRCSEGTHLLYMLPSYGCIFVASCAKGSQWGGTESGREPSSIVRTCRMFTALSASPSTLMARARLWYAAGACTISGTE